MGRTGQFLWPALEQAVKLVRESSDWNPILKSAVGGVACILEQARLCKDNRKAAKNLLDRISEIARMLEENSRQGVDVESQLLDLECLLARLADRLRPLGSRSWLAAYVRAQRDTALLQGCTAELNNKIQDISFGRVLNIDRTIERVLTAVQEQPLATSPAPMPAVTCTIPPIASAISTASDLPASIALASSQILGPVPALPVDSLPGPMPAPFSKASKPAPERLTLFDLGGHKCVLKRSAETGWLQVEADCAVLFAWEVSEGALTARK